MTKSVIMQRHALILDLNGMLLYKDDKPSTSTNCMQIRGGKHWVTLRNGCFEFLDVLFTTFYVGIWSTALLKNVISYIEMLENHAHKKFPFFIVWGQEDCYKHSLRRVCRPDKPHVEAMFKPLLKAWNQCQNICNTKNTSLIDDSPFKGCINPMQNCIFPPPFLGQLDDILCTELLPYLLRLTSTKDIRQLIQLDRFGQLPITESHAHYEHLKDVMEEWHDFTHKFLQEELHEVGTDLESSSASAHLLSKPQPKARYSKVHTTRYNKELSMNQIQLLNRLSRIKNLSDHHAIAYAMQLGYDQGPYISGGSAKSYIARLQHFYKTSY